MKRDSDLRQYGAKGGCNAGMLRRLGRPVGTAVVIVAAFSLLGGCTVHPRILYKDGLRFYHQGKLTEAIAALTEAHERAPADPNISYWLGRCYLDLAEQNAKAGRTSAAMRFADKALLYFNLCLKIVPGHNLALEGKAKALKIKADRKDALAVADWIGRNLELSADSLIARGQAYEAAGELERAYVSYRQAVALEPENAHAHECLGRFLLKIGRKDEAVKHLQKAYRLKPSIALLQTLWDLHALPGEAPRRSEQTGQ